MNGDGFHLVLVVVTPMMLGVAGAIAAWIGGKRWLAWACIAPACFIAAMSYGLWPLRDEIAGPVTTWCRVDAPGIALAIVAMPLVAFTFGRRASSAPCFSLQQAAAGGLAFVPLPLFVGLTWLVDRCPWRTCAGATVVILASTLATTAYVFEIDRVVVDVTTTIALAAHTATLRSELGSHRLVAAALATLAATRSIWAVGL